MSPEVKDPFRSLDYSAAFLDINRRTVIRRVEAGDIPAHKFGRLIRIRQSDLDAYVERSRRGDAVPVEPVGAEVNPRRRPRRTKPKAA